MANGGRNEHPVEKYTSNMFGLISKDKDKEIGSSEVYGKWDPLRDISTDNHQPE